ncbi:uncharacterized protein GGS25DRAFT_240143 [Hypoxylon fragiforme]|uniref:uncharacterized protein n=1 Tax=Hypoxylon fragiforme TaxID=63214 RepID=UPI0020C6E668|nr:uncharacterized protein GGS25DRAFT_240143 [Hypoxylon fragiforme]KAI2609943.1 hypothetical protein GGS25DRAFT_240143 [Hypoxylon fragiforme]
MVEGKDVILVTQFPSDSWFEGFAKRPNGTILAARLDEPDLYTFDAEDKDAIPQPIYNFEDVANGLCNMCPIPDSPDEYLVLSSVIDLANVNFDDIKIWRVALSPDDSSPPQVKQIPVDLSDTGFAIGIIAVTSRIFVIPDSFKGCIWRLDIEKGELTLLIADDSMKSAGNEGDFFGLNRVRVTEDFMWFTNTSAGTLCRIPIDRVPDEPSVGLRVAGPVQVVADDVPHCDGLALTEDQTTAYTCNYNEGYVWKVTIDPPTGKSETSVCLKNLSAPTTVEMAYVDNQPRLYVACCGEIEIGWVRQDDPNYWKEIADINSAVTVTVVTHEETVEAA